MKIKYARRHLFKVLKKNRTLFCAYEWIIGYGEIKKEEASYAGIKPKDKAQTCREKRMIRQFWHCGNYMYRRYGLAYKNLSDAELLEYVPTYYHHKKLEADHAGIDTVKYGDKLVQCRLFSEREIPCANTIAIFENGIWKDLRNGIIADIDALIKEYLCTKGNKVFVKPASGQGGNGIIVLKNQNGSILLNNKLLSSSHEWLDLVNPKHNYIVQLGVKQSSLVSSIYSGSVNTLRVIVQKEGSRMVMKTCSMRIGQNGADVDNSCQGGICIKVDLASGSLANEAKARFDGTTYKMHPDTNRRFSDITLQNWDTLKSQIEEIATKLIDFKNIALDVVVTDNGPLLLEFNFRYGIEHQQIVLGGVKSLLGVMPK